MPSPARDWSSLASDLVRCVCVIFLNNGDIDYYVSLRGVCRAWRAATYDPRSRAPCFRPFGWAMLGSLDRDAAGDQQGSRRLFLNTDTGRFMWKDMPMLHGDAADSCLAADDTKGLLILKPASESGICVLNPFTGYEVSYPHSWASLGRRKVSLEVRCQQRRELYTFWNDCLVIRNCHDQEHSTQWSPKIGRAHV